MRTEKGSVRANLQQSQSGVCPYLPARPTRPDLYTDANRWPFLPNLATSENARGEFALALRCEQDDEYN